MKMKVSLKPKNSDRVELDVPTFFYGTAWKEEATASLTQQALEVGFTAIDTANQRKHYYEEAVGHGLQSFLKSGTKKREELFIQTKYTYSRGQDHRKPYDEDASYAQQVKQSFASSLGHLGVEYLDSYILHGPFGVGLQQEDLEVWSVFEELYHAGKTKLLGVSNFQRSQLESLLRQVKTKPSFVQNRCFAVQGWDKGVRELCQQEGIIYQGFSLLTANQRELASSVIHNIATKHQITIPQVIFCFARQVGMISLTGTTRVEHMQQDLASCEFELTPSEIDQVEHISL